ncbi:hypothetical protein TrVE_jg1667 [Triparma verrucosa]|uniref:Uncharacterized protein n=1 Tax=Triparma verrucosa TaxID=1606542 RepID=A0A9W7FIA0_9STRA|nr:hypothetical protein TrVE_jg1667 [Triparma verrucosa]
MPHHITCLVATIFAVISLSASFNFPYSLQHQLRVPPLPAKLDYDIQALKRMEEQAKPQAPPTPVRLLNVPSDLSRETLRSILSRYNLSEAEDISSAQFTYEYSLATNMFSTRDEGAERKHIPVLVGEENLLRDKGWSFLDEDEAGPPGS